MASADNSIFVLCFVLVFICQTYSVDADVLDSQFESRLDSLVAATMDCRRLAGLTLSVVKDNETWTKGYGHADISTSTPVTDQTLFGIGSVTKSFTMALLGLLLTERNMSWTVKVGDILGSEYKFIDEYRTHEMTVKDLLSHRTGLAGLDNGVLEGFTSDVTREQLAKRFRYIPESKPFRDSFIYNNYMYMYLGHICEVLGGDTWENLLHSRLLTPLGLTFTKVINTPADVQTGDVAKPYIYRDGGFQNATMSLYSIHPLDPAGAILTNGVDMITWMRFLLNKGRLENGTSMVDEKLMNDAMSATIPMAEQFTRTIYFTKPDWPVEATPIGYGHALFMSTYRGYKQIWHTGSFHSYHTIMLLYPDSHTGIFVSTTGPSFKSFASLAIRTISYFLTDGVLNLEPWLNDTTTCSFPQPWADVEITPPPGSYTTKNLSDPTIYTGVYKQDFLTSVTVSVIPDDNTKLAFRANVVSGVLHATSDDDVFKMEVTEPWEVMNAYTDNENRTVTITVVFHREDGKVTNMTSQYDVNLTYVRTHDNTVSGATDIYSGMCFLLISIFLNIHIVNTILSF